MERDAKKMRGARPFVFTNLRDGKGVDEIARFIEQKGGLGAMTCLRTPGSSACAHRRSGRARARAPV